MQKAYIILVHQYGNQLYRLLQKLDDGCSYFFLHIDKNAPLEEFQLAVNNFTTKIKLVKRQAIEWGGFGLVRATINALQAVKDHPVHFNWITLLSGQDYPIKSNEYIDSFFNNTSYTAYLEYTMLPDYERWFPRGGYYRLDKYYLGLSTKSKLAAKTLNLFSAVLPFMRRRQNKMLVPYGGSQWWTINDEMLLYILAFLQNNPLYEVYHKYTFAADEVFFHTIIMNAEQQKHKVKNDSKRFLIWPDTSKAHPEVLEQKDLEAIINSDALFARKFDAQSNEEILDLVDIHCHNKTHVMKVEEKQEEVTVYG